MSIAFGTEALVCCSDRDISAWLLFTQKTENGLRTSTNHRLLRFVTLVASPQDEDSSGYLSVNEGMLKHSPSPLQ